VKLVAVGVGGFLTGSAVGILIGYLLFG
jgi:hypothetical protein